MPSIFKALFHLLFFRLFKLDHGWENFLLYFQNCFCVIDCHLPTRPAFCNRAFYLIFLKVNYLFQDIHSKEKPCLSSVKITKSYRFSLVCTDREHILQVVNPLLIFVSHHVHQLPIQKAEIKVL